MAACIRSGISSQNGWGGPGELIARGQPVQTLPMSNSKTRHVKKKHRKLRLKMKAKIRALRERS